MSQQTLETLCSLETNGAHHEKSVKRVTSYISWIGTDILQDQVGVAFGSVLPVIDDIQLGEEGHCTGFVLDASNGVNVEKESLFKK